MLSYTRKYHTIPHPVSVLLLSSNSWTMGSDTGNVFLFDASSGRPRNAASTASPPSPGFRFPTTNPAPKSSLLDAGAQEFWPKPACLPMVTLPVLHPYRYACEFSPVIPRGAQFVSLPPQPEQYPRPSEFGRIGRENATRALLLSSVPVNVSEGCIVRELECFGPLRAVEMEEIRQGMVTVHFFDVRHSQRALMEIQEQHMLQQSRLSQHFSALMRAGNTPNYPAVLPVPPPARGLIGGYAVWAQYSSAPMRDNSGVGDAHNQGTLVVFNLDSEVSSSLLKNVFEAFGPVKELRETPAKRQHRFVEFFDVRDAARAMVEMNGKDICGKRVKIEFSRPGGQARRLRHNSTTRGGSNFLEASNALSGTSSFSSFPSEQPESGGRLPANWLPPACSPSKNSQQEAPTRGDSSGGNLGMIPRASSSRTTNHGSHDKERRKFKSPSLLHQFQPTHSLPESGSSSTGFNGKTGLPGKNWNMARMNDEDVHLVATIGGEIKLGDPRTTVMIKNIPNKYSQKLLLNMLDQHCIGCNEHITDDEPLSAYDFVYLPIDFKNKCNVGYGFVNLTSPKAAWRLHQAFHKQPWEAFNSRKICEVTYARLQGLEALKEHFKNSKFACDTDEYLPVVFWPPRDGQQLSEPTTIGGHGNRSKQPVLYSLPTNEGSSPSAAEIQQHSGGDDDDDDDADHAAMVRGAIVEGVRHLDATVVDVDGHHPPASPAGSSSSSSVSSAHAVSNDYSTSGCCVHSPHECQ